MRFLRWLGRNLWTLAMSLILAVVTWVVAVSAADPNQERIFQLPVEILGQGTGLEIVSEAPAQLELTLYAPLSNLDRLSGLESPLQAWIDLSGLQAGTHSVPVQYQLPEHIRPVRVIGNSPATAEITLEALITKEIPINHSIKGEPALGYQAGSPEWSDAFSVAAGLASLVDQVVEARVVLDISKASETIERTFTLFPLDAEGAVVAGVTLNPNMITVVQPITLMGGYRNMVIKVMTTGQVAEGYRQTSITVSPPNVMVFSADPTLVDRLPGYVETNELDLSGATDDIETILALNLPEGISVIGDPNVVVLIGVAAIEDSISLSKDVEVIGLMPGLVSQVAPTTVDVILAGPVPDLENLSPVDVRVVVDLAGLTPGTYQLTPQVSILPERIQLQAISPVTIEVTIADSPTPTGPPDGAETPIATPQP